MVEAKVLVILVAIGCCRCDGAVDDGDNEIPGSGKRATTILDSAFKAVVSCAERGAAFTCLRKRAVSALERAASLDELPVWGDSVVLVKSPPTNLTTLDDATDRSVGESVAHFLDSRRVQLRLPRMSYFLPISEGRGKKNRGYGLVAMTIAGAMMAMGMAGLAAMAGKALAASMAALMLALMAALRKGGGGHHGDSSSYEVISIPSHHHHRSLSDEDHLNNPYRYDTDSNVHHDNR